MKLQGKSSARAEALLSGHDGERFQIFGATATSEFTV